MNVEKIYNPVTKKFVMKYGAVGKKVIKEYGYQEGYVFDFVKNKYVPPPSGTSNPLEKVKSPKTSPKKSPKTLKLVLMNTNITLSKINNNPHDPRPRLVQPIGITVDRLEELVKDPSDTFLKKLQASIVSLARHKIELYKNSEMLPIHSSSSFYSNLISLNTNFITKASKPTFIKELRADLLEAINDRKFGMRSLIGRDKVMNKLASLIFAFSKNYKVFTRTFMNFAIFGSAGLGKSALAKVIAFVFK